MPVNEGSGGCRPRFASVVFDVDSTLASIEGIDWLADLRSESIAHECRSLTARAMSGELPIESVYSSRLRLIRPSMPELLRLGEAYKASLVAGMDDVVDRLQKSGVIVHLLSGGILRAILPLAKLLGVREENVHAVELAPDIDGTFCLFDGEQPLATQTGKPLMLSRLALPRQIAMIGDGSTDAATSSQVDAFFAFTGVVRRDSVVAVSTAEADSATALFDLLFQDC